LTKIASSLALAAKRWTSADQMSRLIQCQSQQNAGGASRPLP